MFTVLMLTFWEIRRILRTRTSVALLVVSALLCAAASRIFHNGKPVRYDLLAVSILAGWLMLYVRRLSDRANGFADGIESTPAAGFSHTTSRVIIAALVTVFQIGLFLGASFVFGLVGGTR